MKPFTLFCACCLALAANAIPMASQQWVTNRINEAVAAIPAPDYSTNNTTLVETIKEAAPQPGDYETTSNKASKISLPDEDGHPGGLFSPYFNGRAKEAKDAYGLKHSPQDPSPGALSLNWRGQEDAGIVYTVWWPRFLDAWNVWHWVASEDYVGAATNGLLHTSGGTMTGTLGIAYDLLFNYGNLDGPVVYAQTPAALCFGSRYDGYSEKIAILDLDRLQDNEPADIAFLHEVATPETVTNIVREVSRGGVWDEEMQVWWTPVMSNGKLTYQATTNVNLSVESN